MNLALNLQAN